MKNWSVHTMYQYRLANKGYEIGAYIKTGSYRLAVTLVLK